MIQGVEGPGLVVLGYTDQPTTATFDDCEVVVVTFDNDPLDVPPLEDLF